MRNTWDIANLRGVQNKRVLPWSLQLVTGSSEIKKKGSLVTDIMLRMDEGIWKFLIFRKMADVEIQSCLFDQNFTHIFGYKKSNRPKKNPSSIRRTIMYQISEKNFKLIVQAVLKYSDHRLRKHGFEKNALKVLSRLRRLHSKSFISINNNPICLEFSGNTFEIFYF